MAHPGDAIMVSTMVKLAKRLPTGAARRRPHTPLPWHLLAATFVAVAVLAQIFRPVAPDLGPLPDPRRWFDADYLVLASRYQAPRYVGFAIAMVLRVGVPLLVAFSRPGRCAVERVVSRVGRIRPARAAAAVAVVVTVVTDLTMLPVAFWLGFVHEGNFGFRTQGLAGWAVDWVLSAGPTWVLTGMLALGGFALIRRLPRSWPVAAGVAGVFLTVVGVFVAPLVLEPLRFDLRPLEGSAVRDEVSAVADSAGFTVETVLVADASRRTTKVNAYVSGLGATRRIVLYDTLIDEPVDEIGLVLAHEFAHDRNGDLWRGTLFGGAGVVVGVYLVTCLLLARSRSGAQHGIGDPRAMAVIVALLSVVNVAAVPLQSVVSRRAEAAADLGALEITGDAATYQRMTERLARTNLSEPIPPQWYRLLRLTHPPVASRLELGRRWPFPERERSQITGRDATLDEDAKILGQARDDVVPVEMVLDEAPAGSAHPPATVGIGQQCRQRIGHRADRVAVHEEARLPVEQRLRGAAAASRDHGTPARLGLEERHAEALLLEAEPAGAVRHGEDVTGGVVGGQLAPRHPPGECDRTAGQATRGPCQPPALRAVPDQQQARVGDAAPDLTQRLDEHVLTLAGHQTADADHDGILAERMANAHARAVGCG